MKRCFSCDIELPADVLISSGHPYCCSGCAVGGPCSCTYEGQPAPQHANGHTDPVLTRELLGLIIKDSSDERPEPWK